MGPVCPGPVLAAAEVPKADPLRELPPMVFAQAVAGRQMLLVVRQRNEAAFLASQAFQNDASCPSPSPVDATRKALTAAELRRSLAIGVDAEHAGTVSTVRIES